MAGELGPVGHNSLYGGEPLGDLPIWDGPEAFRAQGYDELDWPKDLRLLLPIIDLAAPRGDETLLDVGTGTGDVLLTLQPHVRHAIGLDVSEAMLAPLQDKVLAAGIQNVSLVRANITEGLPIADNSIDIVASRMMLHGLPNRTDAIRKMGRTVRPGGIAVLSECVFDTCTPEAIALAHVPVDERPSLFIPSEHFQPADARSKEFHHGFFILKHEPTRALLSGGEFVGEVNAALEAEGFELATSYYTLLPANSVNNWLGKTGSEDAIAIKQQGILACLETPVELLQKLGIIVTVDGQPVDPANVASLAKLYPQLEEQQKDRIDALIPRPFINVVARKKEPIYDRAAA